MEDTKKGTRQYDILVWGATGFTGEKAAKYLIENAPLNVKIALGGRNKDKLDKVQKKLKEAYPNRVCIDVLVGNSADKDSMKELVSQTKVVLSTVGPYLLYGSNLVEACAYQGTDYCDITGETHWVEKMHNKYNHVAEDNNAHIVSFCGFDSVPADMGSFMLSKYAKNKYGVGLKQIKASLTDMNGSISGGTLATMFSSFEYRQQMQKSKPHCCLCHRLHNRFCGKCKSGENTKDQAKTDSDEKKTETSTDADTSEQPLQIVSKSVSRFPALHYDSEFGKWQYPSFMGSVNMPVTEWGAKHNHYGPGSFYYFESYSATNLFWAIVITFSLFVFKMLLLCPVTRRLLKRMVTQPGSGPSEEDIKKGHFVYDLVSELEPSSDSSSSESTPHKIYGRVVGTSEPGYGETITYLCEAALCLLLSKQVRAGIYTPSIAFGDTYLDRLREKGCEFVVSETPYGSRSKKD